MMTGQRFHPVALCAWTGLRVLPPSGAGSGQMRSIALQKYAGLIIRHRFWLALRLPPGC